MVALRPTLLGGFDARLAAGDALSLPTKKAQALLAYLGLRPGQTHQRDKLAALLWAERSDEHARDGLRHALVALRRALPGVKPPSLLAEGQTLGLNPAVVEVDVATFERRVVEGTPEALEQAAELYRGDLLLGFTVSEPLFEEWLVAERERLREIALEALARLLAHQTKSGGTERAIQTAVRLLGLEIPCRKRCTARSCGSMRARGGVGQHSSSTRRAWRCCSVSWGVEPEAETKQLYQEMLRRPASATRAPGFRGDDRSRPARLAARARVELPAGDTPLFGREVELGRLRELLDEAIRGHGQVATVLGEAGIGKTRLLAAVAAIVGEAGVGKTRLVAELAAEAPASGGRVLIGRAHASEQILPFGPWVDALAIGRERVDGAWLETLPGAVRSELGRLLPELGSTDGAPATPPDFLKLFEAVGVLLKHLAEKQPTILILEDFHWADEMSVRLLAFITRRLPAWRLLLLVTVRAEDLFDAPMLQRTLDELEREPQVTTLALGPLSQDHTLDLVRFLARPGSEDVEVARLSDRVWRTSAGNPLVVIELMRAAAHDAFSHELDALPLPERVQTIIGRQLDRLDQRSHELVTLAAVIGREFEFALLQHVCGFGEGEVARRLEDLTRRRVLHSVGERFDFTHDHVREVAYGRILAPRRKILHRQVAEALAALHAGNLESHHLALGLHYHEGEVWDKAIAHLRRAGARAVERSANREAAACFERALAALSRLPESRETLEDAFDIRLQLRTALSRLAEIRRSRERLREAETLAERLSDDRRRSLACAFLTNVHSWLGELDVALALGSRALELAGALGDVELQFLATTYLAQAHYHRGEYERVVLLASHNLAALPAHRAHDYFIGVDAPASVYDRAWLVLGLGHLGRFAEAIDQATEMSRLAESTQYAFPLCSAYYGVSALHLLRGDWVKAGQRSRSGSRRLARGTSRAIVPMQSPGPLGRWRNSVRRVGRCVSSQMESCSSNPRLRRDTSALLDGTTMHWVAPACSSGESTTRDAWGSARSKALRLARGSRPMRCTCSATSRPIPTGLMWDAAKPTTARRWPSPSRAACAPSSPTATSASASSIGARTSASRRRSTSPPRRRCTSRWA
jgi:DNA-binding SARP family transcriptional activator